MYFHTKQVSKSQVSDKTGLGFDSQVFNSQVFNYGELHSHESDNRVPKNPENDRYNTGEGYHVVPPLYTGTFLPPKPDLVFTDDPTGSESVANVFNVKSSINKPIKDMSETLRPDVAIVEDWISDSEDETKIVSVPKQREPSFVKSSEHMKTSRESFKKVQHHKQAANLRTNNQKSRVRMTHPHSNRNVVPTTILTRSRLVSLNAVRPAPTAVTQSSVQSPWPVKHVVNKAHSPGNPRQALNDKCVIDSGNPKGGKISSKGKIKTGKLDIADVYFVKELKFNLFSVSQMCDKKNNVLFTDTECVVLSSDYKLPDKNHVLLRVPKENNMYNVDLKNVVPSGGLTCLFAKATLDESNLWHRMLEHINFKTMNKLVKGNLARGLPLKIFENNYTCVACQKGKQHRAYCKSKPVSSVSQPLQRYDNKTEFKNYNLNQFCEMKEIKREYSVAKTPQQNGVAERKNRTLIEVARTMLADSLLPIPFWAEAVNTACYVQNRVLVTKPHNKTPYELLLRKFDMKADEGFLVRYSVNCKAFRVFNSRTRIVQETLHIYFLENKSNVAGIGPKLLFDIDTLTMSMNYQPVVAGNQPNNNADLQNIDDDVADAAFDVKENENDVHDSVNGSDKTSNKKHDEKAKRDDKG
nr:hypothetical protein [Tanacetum cinerariifolium]